ADAQGAANTEFGQLKTELDRIAQSTKFGSQSLLNAGIGGSTPATGYSGNFQVDASSVNANASSQIKVDLSQTALSSATGYVAGTGLGGVNKGINGFDAAGLGLSMSGVDLT
ncbi:hypothetical protein HC030_30845, partial [Planosporangium mesophilum]|nr:hypothetical protein [Planosporangium mesophilum]